MVVGPMFFFPTVPATGFVLYSTVDTDDPTRLVMVAVSIVDEYFRTVLARSPHVAVAVTDHTGAVATSRCGLQYCN